MSDDFELSRRKALAALGSIGVASAGAGLGTSAYFSDQETFQNNRLVAGELDLKMDWEEHYSDWSPDENEDRSEPMSESEDDDGEGEFEVLMEAPDNPDEYLPFPPGAADPLLWVPNAYVDDFMDNTAIEGYPDPDNDGIAAFPVEEMQDRLPCDFLADVGDDDAGLDPDSDPLGRTDNDDTRLDDGSPAPLINLNDVKPGDFGEITFSTHLCDNDGYLWMNMPGGLNASENGFTEPELDDPDEDGPGGDVELVDQLQTALWYDNNCDNLITREGKIDIFAVVDTSGSIDGSLRNNDDTEENDLIRQAANQLLEEFEQRTEPGQVNAGLLTFNGGADEGAAITDPTVESNPVLRADLGPLDQFDTDNDGDFDIGELDQDGDPQFVPAVGFGNTPMPQALDLAQKILDDQGRPDAQKCILLVGDGLPEYENGANYDVTGPTTGTTYSSDSFSAGFGNSTERTETADEAEQLKAGGISIIGAGIGLDANDDAFFINNIVGDDADPTTAQPDFYFDIDAFANFPDIVDAIAQKIVGKAGDSVNGPTDEVIFTGSLGELATALTANDGRGIPLDADRATSFDETNGEPENSPDRECFTATTTHCFGLSWWLPVDHANELQGDGVSFDLGFYTEQCRHNDGSGMNNEDVDPEETDA